MIITGNSIQTLRRQFNAAFNSALMGAPPNQLEQAATSIPMSTAVVELGMIKNIPGLRKWVGDRVFHRLAAHGYFMQAETYEDSIEIPREHIEDDNTGLFVRSMEMLAMQTAMHADDLLVERLEAGGAATSLGYDGVPFFSASHPEGGTTVANTSGTGAPAWYLMDLSKPVRPLILGRRTAPEFVAQDSPDSEAVFLADSIRYGVRVRTGTQYGLWQLAYRRGDALDAANFNATWEAMAQRVDDSGRSLGIRPTHLFVPPALYSDARNLIAAQFLANGGSNTLYQSVTVVECPKLSSGNL